MLPLKGKSPQPAAALCLDEHGSNLVIAAPSNLLRVLNTNTDPITLLCGVGFLDDSVNVTWLHNDDVIAVNNATFDDTYSIAGEYNLVIDSPVFNDGGTYTCNVGELERHAQVILLGEYIFEHSLYILEHSSYNVARCTYIGEFQEL